MKKYLITMLGVAAILSFISCGSTPTTEPVDTGSTEESSNDNSSKEIGVLLSQAELARQEAINAGAEKYFPEVLAATDKYYEEVKANPTVENVTEVTNRYKALATACQAKELQKKAKEFGVSDPNAEKALADFEAAGEAKGMKENADKAFKAYTALLFQHLGTMAKSERNAAVEAKKKADSVKAGVARKAEYTNASNTFKKADSAFVTKDLEAAFKGYSSAKNTFQSLYDDIYEKRAAAQAAIERAKKRVAEAENYTKEADSIAPLTGEVAGIEKEDAVLLEKDNFANPDEAVIDIESSDTAKKAAALDGAAIDASNAGGSK